MRPVLPFDWREVPFVRLLLPLLLGFLVSKWLLLTPFYAAGGMLGCISLQQLYQRSVLRNRWRWRYVPGILFFVAVVLLGTALPDWKDAGQQPNHIRNFQDDKSPAGWLLIRLIETPEQKARSVKIVAEARWLEKSDNSFAVQEK